MTAPTQPDRSTRAPAQEPAPAPAEVPAPTAPTAGQLRMTDTRGTVSLPRNLGRLTAQAEKAGWTTTVQTQPGHCALLLTARQEAGETALHCVWRLTARGFRWDGATLTRYGQQTAEGIAWGAVGDLVAAEAPTARTQPTAPDLSMSFYGKRGASPVTAEVVSASIATTPGGEVPVLLRPWIKAATVPVTLYPSRFVGRDYFGADCLLTPEGDDAAPDTEPVLSVLPADYLTSNADYLEDLAAYAVEEGRTQAEGSAFGRWVIASGVLWLGDYRAAYAAWLLALTCTMTATDAMLTCTRMRGTGLSLQCGCGQNHTGTPWEHVTVWDDEGCHYLSFGAVPMDRIADLIAARGYRVTGEWSTGDVVRRVTVEPTAVPGAETVEAAADAPQSDPGTAGAWESDGGACPGVEPPRGPEPGPTSTPGPHGPGPTGDAPAAPPAAPSADEVATLPKNARTLAEAATAHGWDVTVTASLLEDTYVRAVTVTGAFPVRAGVEEFTARCVWDGARYWGSASERDGRYGAGFRDVLAWVRDVRAVNRADEETGRTVWGRYAAEWRRQLTGAVTKIAEAAAQARSEHDQVTSAAAGRAGAALADAGQAHRDAVDAFTRAQHGYRETGGEDARPLAAERAAVLDAGKRVRAALEQVKDAPRATEAETLALVAIAEAERQQQAEEEAWRTRLAAEGREPTAAAFASLVQMFQDPTRAWVAWHAEHGRAGEPFREAKDRWTQERYGKEHRSVYTRAYLTAHDALSAARGALAVAVGTALGGEEGERLVRLGKDCRHRTSQDALASWLRGGWKADARAAEFAEQHPDEAEAVRVARLTVDGVEAYRSAERDAWEAEHAKASANSPS
ncbi:hypothetical protein [Streptomyces sp. NBC_00827]|uniref:hypothetical protein n=1 Tax=Streptomyces sp. NBC_00827 TaxID=2903677 RepID=UPI00386DD086|nr:hypothetical protein OG569_42595 [Streptomyces sp. NBC_00827]